MARHHTAIRARTPYPASGPYRAIALTVPSDTDLSGALCTAVAPEAFFPETPDGAEEQLAKRICAVCPVRAACLALAIGRDDRFGVFGGLTPAERDALTGRPSGCGSRAGYRRHRIADEPACAACLAANTADSAARRTAESSPLGLEVRSLEAAA